MAAVRVFAFLLLVAFAVQLVMAGVTRRDTESQPDTDLQNLVNDVRTQMEALVNTNISEVFSDAGTQLQSWGTAINEMAQRLAQGLANSVAASTAAPATR